MAKYKDYAKELDALKAENEFIFRTAFYELMEKGKVIYTDDAVERTCKEIMSQDDSKSIISNEYQCAIVRTVWKLAKYDGAVLAVYFGKYFGNSINNMVF